MMIRTMLAATCAVILIVGSAAAHDGQTETVTPKFNEAIPNIPGKSLVVVEVDYAPGAASPSHTHARSAFIYAYVLSGEIESKVNDGETRIYKVGESWSEPPNARHQISRNASKIKPAKLLAVFVVDSDDKVLTTPVKQEKRENDGQEARLQSDRSQWRQGAWWGLRLRHAERLARRTGGPCLSARLTDQ